MPYGWRQRPPTSKRPKHELTTASSLASERYNIHADRIFLVGHGSGGTMALRVAWNNPAKYAGVATHRRPAALAPYARFAASNKSVGCRAC